MTTEATPLNEAQKSIVEAGKNLAKQLGLTPFSTNETPDIEFTEGRIGLVVSPYGINLGVFEVKGWTYPKNRYTEYRLKDLFYFRKDEWLDEGKWKPSASSFSEVLLPPGATLYVA